MLNEQKISLVSGYYAGSLYTGNDANPQTCTAIEKQMQELSLSEGEALFLLKRSRLNELELLMEPNPIAFVNALKTCGLEMHGVMVFVGDEFEYFGDKRIQVSIFMSLFNVHANWYPVAGKVIKTAHHSGRHMAAYLPKSSTENERSTIVIETPSKTQILVRQIAGALARRIVTYAHVGKTCHLNEHIGFIKFGSRVDIFLPLDAEIFVEIGESTTGNETIIARLNED